MAGISMNWIICFLLLIGIFVSVGLCRNENKKWYGVLIDQTNRVSLSRLQIVCWSILVLSAWTAVVLSLRSTDFSLTGELVALMGISVGSAGGAVIVKQQRLSSGSLIVKTDYEPHFKDIFMNEGKNSDTYVGNGKVQMFYITLAALVGYGYTLWRWEIPGENIAFPALSESLLYLIGISHGGYLTIKGVSDT